MMIKDAFGRWHDVTLDSSTEVSLWQTGEVQGGFYNPFEQDSNNANNSNEKGQYNDRKE